MSRHLLDTNIIGNVTKPAPSAALVAWMAEQADEDLFISSLTVAEIRRGLLEKPAGKKRKELERWFAGPEGPPALFSGRVLPFDEKAGLVWARLMADGTAAGQPRSPLDMIIAAVAEADDCVLVTDNERDFIGLKIGNPLRDGKRGPAARGNPGGQPGRVFTRAATGYAKAAIRVRFPSSTARTSRAIDRPDKHACNGARMLFQAEH